jgi:hypothetical protein
MNLLGKRLEIPSTAFPLQLLIKIDQAMKINFGEFIKTHSFRFSLTGDRRDYIFNPSFCLQNERKDANDG